MADPADWLSRLGLDQYAAVFREHDITADVLPRLTADDLKDLGVESVGHRRRLLDAIAALRADAPPARSGAERRQLSVMFCDVIGSTAMAHRLDPEDLSSVIRLYQACVATTVERFGGFVARYVGDGVLIYFGWPEAHEADAEQAVRAALAVIDAVGEVPSMESLKVRIGIATGLVVIGEPIGAGHARQQTAIGETPNLAARLQGLAEPDSVVIDAETRRQIGGLFLCHDLGPVVLRGLPEPVAAWQVLEPAEVESRFEAFHAGAITPLIGRDEELDLLLRRWRQAKAGEGQLVLIAGEPGMGKSRLIAALAESLRGESHQTLRYFCSPYHQDSALYPMVARWERDLRFTRGDTPQQRLRKLEEVLVPRGRSPEEIALIADMLSLPVDDRYPSLGFNPQLKRERLFETMMGGMVKRAHRQPLVILFEDAHWADASSIELLDKAINLLANLPVLMVVSHRPEFRPPWLGLAVASPITLRRLTPKQAMLLAERILRERALPPALLERIVAQTDGVPPFIEELTRALLESAEQTDGTVAPLVPTTLQGSLTARLDRLPAAKRIAQIGAVIGREFGHGLLGAVAGMGEPELAQGIEALVASGLAFHRDAGADVVYIFKHALVRDTAYSTLLRSQRQELHARIGDVLEQNSPEIVDAQPELLAQHFTQAGLADRAIDHWRRAGLRSARHSAHTEARAHFACALDLLDRLPAGEQRNSRELDLTLNHAVSLIAVRGFGSEQVEACALRAKDLADRLPDSPSRFAAHRLAWNSCLMRQPIPRTVELARDLLGMADAHHDPAKLAVAHRALGYSLLMAGEFRAGEDRLAQGAAVADTLSRRAFHVYGEQPAMVCRTYRGQARIILGFPDSGALLVEEAIALAREEENAHSLAWALAVAAHIFQIHHEAPAAGCFATEALETARTHNLPQWRALGERCLGWAMHRQGNYAEGMELQMRGVKRWADTGAALHATHCASHLVDSLLREGRIAEARTQLDTARAHSAKFGEVYLSAELDRLDGLLLKADRAPAGAVEELLARSLDTARRQGARLFELRTATAYARLLAERGEQRAALDLLALVYGWFTQGFETTDLRAAKALLETLGGVTVRRCSA